MRQPSSNSQPRPLHGQRVLITGASGFIGSHLRRRLDAVGVETDAVSRTRQGRDRKGVRWWQGDVGDSDFVRGLFKELEPDVVFHLASHVMGSPSLEHVLPTFRGNLQSTVNLLTAAAEYGCRRIVLAGSLSEPDPGEAFPSCPIAAAKWASSAYGRMFHALYGVPVVIARVFMVYGPEQRDLSKLVPYVTLSLMAEKAPSITSGTRLVDWIYVTDVVEGLVAAAQAPGMDGLTVDLGSGSLVSIRAIVERIEGLVGAKVNARFGALPDRPFEPVRVANIAATSVKTGWQPTTSLDVGLRQTVAWYRTRADALVGNNVATTQAKP